MVLMWHLLEVQFLGTIVYSYSYSGLGLTE